MRGSPISPLTELDVELGGEVERFPGDVERVFGTFTTMESAVDVAFVETELLEPVRKREAARRGRLFGTELLVGVLVPMRAASWFSEGMRPAEGPRSGLGTSIEGGAGAGGLVVMAVMVDSPQEPQPLQQSRALLVLQTLN